MTLITIDRFTGLLRNAFRVVGPYAPDLPFAVAPVYDLARPDAAADDAVAYWYTNTKNLAALAANFSTVSLIPGGGGRYIVDGLTLNNTTAAAAAYVLSIAAGAVGTPVAAFLANPFTSRAGLASPQTLANLNINATQSVGGLLAGVGFNVVVPIGASVTLSALLGTLPPFVLSAAAGGGSASSLVVESNVVNAVCQVGSIWGRWFPEAPTA